MYLGSQPSGCSPRRNDEHSRAGRLRAFAGHSAPVPELSIPDIIRTLNEQGVRYVVIGGVAALVHNLPLPMTIDLDVTPSRDDANLDRLADAFESLDAALLTADEHGTWFPRRPVDNWREYDPLHLVTRFGLFDIVFEPDGAPGGYDDLIASAEEHPIVSPESSALVISVAQWEHLKRAAGRAKDLEHLDRYLDDR
jgi:hypothetical protein